MHRSVVVSLFVAALILMPSTASAYIGPGLGAGAIAAVFGVIGSILLALFAVIYYPIKRIFRKKRGGEKPATTDKPVK